MKKLIGLSNYGDLDTRYGDCALLYDDDELTVYDCGHERHADTVIDFLKGNRSIIDINLVFSHNDCDHTDGAFKLMDWLYNNRNRFSNVNVYTQHHDAYSEEVDKYLDDDRRKVSTIEKAINREFSNILKIRELAEQFGFKNINAEKGVKIGKDIQIAGPLKEKLIETIACAISADEPDKIGEGNAAESVMNAASIQISVTLEDDKKLLLCGDASPDLIVDIKNYDYIQLPHHGQKEDADSILEELGGVLSYNKVFYISDNTGSAENSGGSKETTTTLIRKRLCYHNTKDKRVMLPNGYFSNVWCSERKLYAVDIR